MKQIIKDDVWEEFKKETEKYKNFDISKLQLTSEDNKVLDKFFKDFLDPNQNFPEGARHSTIEKNFAIYIVKNKIDIEPIKEAYESKGFHFRSLLSQIKGVYSGTYGQNPHVSIGELVNWCKQHRPDMVTLFREINPKIIEERKDFEVIWEKDLKNHQQGQIEWTIQNLIPNKSVGVWTGKRGTLKTFLTLNAGICVSKGIEFLGRYQTARTKVLYLDKENGTGIIKQRTEMIKKGLGLENEDLDIAYICFSQLKIDKISDIISLGEVIEQNGIGLLIIDTYRRAISFDENSAGDVSKLFVDTLRPLVEKYNLSIILIHHDKKGVVEGDEMDMIRGSSDLANYCDFILKNDRKGKNIVLKQLKCRNAPEISPVSINYETDETSFFTFKSLGDFVPQTQEDKACEVILLWITEQGLNKFKTKDAIEVAFRKGVKKTNFYAGLDSLVARGIIQSISKGEWEVIDGSI